jgi:hypothetical protein
MARNSKESDDSKRERADDYRQSATGSQLGENGAGKTMNDDLPRAAVLLAGA